MGMGFCDKLRWENGFAPSPNSGPSYKPILSQLSNTEIELPVVKIACFLRKQLDVHMLRLGLLIVIHDMEAYSCLSTAEEGLFEP